MLDLPARPALAREDFFVSPANALALAQVDRWPDWPSGRLALAGPEGAGKTHLVHVWAAAHGSARVMPASALAALDVGAVEGGEPVPVEDVDRLPAAGREVADAIAGRATALPLFDASR